MLGIAPAQIDQARRARRRAADGVNERKIVLEEIVAGDAARRRALPLRERAGGIFQFLRAHVVRGRIDEIACERHAVDDAREVGAVHAIRQHQTDLAIVTLAVTREAIGAEREGERGEPRIVRCVGETIKPVRQQSGEASRQEQVARAVRLFEPEQHCAEPAVGAGQGQIASGLGFETGGLGERARGGIELAGDVAPARRRHEGDRNGLG